MNVEIVKEVIASDVLQSIVSGSIELKIVLWGRGIHTNH